MRVSAIVPVYKPRSSALHTARAAAAHMYLGAVCVAAFVFSSPLVLAGLLAALIGVAALTGSIRDLKPFLVMALVVGLLIAFINALVSGQGLTVLVRGPALPVVGAIDVTLEGCIYGLLMGLRVALVMVAAGIYTVAVDPDRVLRLFSRIGFRSALTVAVATRLVPTLGRDAQRLGEAHRCRPDFSSESGRVGLVRSKAPVLRALLVGSLERAADIAMALETKGFGRGKVSSGMSEAWTLSDAAFTFSGVTLLSLTVAAMATGAGSIQVYPRVEQVVTGSDLVLALTIALLVLLPITFGRAKSRGGG